MFKIYIGNLENGVTLDQLKELMKPFPDLEDLVLVMDPETGESRCFAIAMFREKERAQLLIETLSGRILNGRPMVVNEAVKKGKALPPKKDLRRPTRGPGGAGGGMRGEMGGSIGGAGMSGPPRIPVRPPSGRPSSRPFARGNSRRDFGSAAGGGQGGFSRGPGDGAPERPRGSSGFVRPQPPPAVGPGNPATPPAPRELSQVNPQQTGGVVPPLRPAAPKPPVVRRLDTPPEEGTPRGA